MKALTMSLIIGFILATTLLCNSQKPTPIFIKEIRDEMTDSKFYEPSQKMVMERKNQGFTLSPSIDANFEVTSIYCTMHGFGNCTEENNLIILFEDSTRIFRNSLTTFNCEGFCFFDIGRKDREVLRKKRIIKIRFTNGYNSEMFTSTILPDDKRRTYFIRFYEALELERNKRGIKENPKDTLVSNSNAIGDVIPRQEERNKIYTVVEKQPQFVGGISEMMGFIQKSINYPKEAAKMGIEGKVIVGFNVLENGTLEDIQVLNGIGYGCDEEALRVVSIMPKWEAGEMAGKKVVVKMTIPIKFRLPK